MRGDRLWRLRRALFLNGFITLFVVSLTWWFLLEWEQLPAEQGALVVGLLVSSVLLILLGFVVPHLPPAVLVAAGLLLVHVLLLLPVAQFAPPLLILALLGALSGGDAALGLLRGR